jgi:FkbM family methyltransferase
MSTHTAKVRIFNRVFDVCCEENDLYFQEYAARGEYAESLLTPLRYLIEDDFVCLDIGANIGLFSLALASLARRGKVYACEPNPKTFTYLEKNVAANRLGNVSCLPWAFSAKKETLRFNSNDTVLACSFALRQDAPPAWSDLFTGLVSVEATTVDDLVRETGLDRIDCIKIDVEGFELDVLKGARDTLERYHPAVLVEFNSLTFVRHANVSPRDALDQITALFDETYVIERQTGALQLLSTERGKDAFLYHNMTAGLVDNLLCTAKTRQLVSRIADHFQERDRLAAECDAAHREAQRLLGVVGEQSQEHERLTAERNDAQREVHRLLDVIRTQSQERDRLTAERDAAHCAVQRLLDSNSWKVTAPLRRLSRLLRSPFAGERPHLTGRPHPNLLRHQQRN